jgi:hypothetical protein
VKEKGAAHPVDQARAGDLTVERVSLGEDRGGAVGNGDADEMMRALHSHVPITLLMDIGELSGPDSAEIAEVEGGQADWLQASPG